MADSGGFERAAAGTDNGPGQSRAARPVPGAGLGNGAGPGPEPTGDGGHDVRTRLERSVPDDRRARALSAARRRARRSWFRYGAGLAVFLIALLVFMFSVWRTSEIRAVRSHPTAKAARELPTGALPSSMQRLWQTTDRLAQGQPVYLDVVTTYSEHTVVGRDATTGAVRWSYSRSDRKICSVVGDGGAVLAIYRHDGNCDELTGLDADTGKRAWTRTQFENGTPSTQAISQFLLQLTPDVVDLIRPDTGGVYWYYPQVNNCKTIDGVVGTTGVLWGTNCASGTNLTLRIGSGDKSKNNAWSVALNGRTPLSADDQITVLSADHRSIQVLAAKDGKISSTIPLTTPITPPSVPYATPSTTTATELISVPGQVIAIASRKPTAVSWQRATTGRAFDSGSNLYFPAAGRIDIVSPGSGVTVRTVSAPGLAADATVAGRGAGIVAGTAAGTSAWG